MSYKHPPLVRRVLTSLVPVVCPPEAVALGLTEAIVDHVELTMGALPATFRQGLALGLATYDNSARLWPPALGRRASALPLELADRWFLRWEEGFTPIERELAKAVGQLLKLGCYEQPAMQARLGYTPSAWIDEVKQRRLKVYSDDVRKAEAAITAPDPLRPPVKKVERA
ncbi:MAG TPA: hypothetical protein VM734_24120 [Kofleriaceae bacterium]|jgi:hypothetical protein|nr:hypothetical protein [Kofleriaceae bacterium]